MSETRKLIMSLDYAGLRNLLSSNPSLANAGIALDERDNRIAHPLHRICDGVFNKIYSDAQAVELANIFLDHGASVNGFGLVETRDTPLIAAASLHAEQVGMVYIDRGANIHHPGTHGGTALHWAAWVGRDKLVDKLIKAGADIHKKCIEFRSTPLQWAIHGSNSDNGKNHYHQAECIKLLIAAGAENP